MALGSGVNVKNIHHLVRIAVLVAFVYCVAAWPLEDLNYRLKSVIDFCANFEMALLRIAALIALVWFLTRE